ncbi:MAG TPA: TonB-dependent receptor, partial [Gemmatimonadaceae bacterium]|nr:TonB-dependent receptor [Gemmatimonadaceae bacterium]
MNPRFVLTGSLAALLAVATALAPIPLAAQTSTGTVRGYVRGTTGAPIAGATIVLRDLATNQQRATQTNASGFYSVGGLRPSRYELTARRVGMQQSTRTLRVAIGQALDVNLVMTEQAVALQAVEVTAAAVEETRTSEVATNISREQIENLPNFERNFLDIARLAPGITARNVNSTDKVIAAAGQPAEAVNIFVDGATYKNDVLRGGVVGQDASKGNPFPQGAVQEFRIITQQYKAEYQKAASAVITATTRSGSNEWEGDAFAYGVGSNWVARDAFTVSRDGPSPSYERLQAGGSIGGPIARDRLFFFGTYELNFRDEPFNVFFGGDSALAPIALRDQLRPQLGQFNQEFRQHLGFGKLTWIASDRSTVDASFTLRNDDDFRNFGGQTSTEAAENMRVDVYTGVLNWRWAGERWLNETQVSGQSFIWNPTWQNGNLIGHNYRNLLRIGGKDTEQDFQQDRVSLRNDVTRSGVRWLGDHVIKAGANVDFLRYSSAKRFTENPVFEYQLADNFARPFQARFGFGNPTIETDNTQFGFYVQDDWQITPRLVLNLGLRWDAETNMINNDYVTPQPLADSLRGLDGQLFVNQPLPGGGTQQVRVIDQLGGLERYLTRGSSDREMYQKAFQPRIGASYDLFGDGRTVLFGGYGIYYDRNYWNTLLDEQFRRQYSVLTVQFRDVCLPTDPANCVVWDERYFDPAQLRSLAGTAGLPEVFLVANDLTPPRTD